jgi:hypothetical protein
MNIMKKLIKNKKGAVGSIIDSIGRLIQGITNTLPKPVLFIIFLFILATIGWVISLIFNATGIYCNSANEPVKLNANFISNIALVGEIPDYKNLNKEIIDDASNQQFGAEECILQVKNATITYDDGTTETLVNRKIYRNQGCVICLKSGYVTEERAGLDIGGRYCADNNVYPKALEDKTFLERTLCGDKLFGRCQPPEHYYWNYLNNYYVCGDNTCTGTTLGTSWDELLASKDAQLLYYNQGFDKSSEGFVSVTCNELRPKLGIYGIDILTYTNWVIITVLIIIFWLWKLA